MKKQGCFLLAVLGIAAACNRESVPGTTNPGQDSNAVTLTVVAGKPGTRTAIDENDEEFPFTWKAGDRIALVEGCAALEYDACETYKSEPLSKDTKEAVFTVHLQDREDLPGTISYTATYPTHDNDWEYPIGYYEGGQLYLGMEFPISQYPLDDSFDPKADLLVSKAVYENGRPGESVSLSFSFARVGTIVKMVISGLPENSVIKYGEIDFGYQAGYYFEYYPESMLIKGRDGTEYLTFSYEGEEANLNGLKVGSDGCAVVWLRCMSGVSKCIDLRIEGSYPGGGYWHRHRRISFRAKGTTLPFKEGGLTSFTVKIDSPDVENPEPETVQYWTNSTMDGVTVSWPDPGDADLAGYEAFLLDENDTRYDFLTPVFSSERNRWEAVIGQGLAPGDYTLYLRANAVTNKVPQPDFMEKELSIGIPQSMSIYGGVFPGSYYNDQNSEITYRDVLFGYRNMCYGSGWSASAGSLPWAFWNKDPLHLGILRVTPRNSYATTAFQVYASDDPFENGLPNDTAVLLNYTEENGYKEFSLNGKKYFLLTGSVGIFLNGVYLEYCH